MATEPVQQICKSLKTIHNEISKKADRRIKGKWNALSRCRIAKIICKRALKKNIYAFLLTRSQKDYRTVVDPITGHNLVALNASRSWIHAKSGRVQLICFCTALLRTRLRYLLGMRFKRLAEV